MCQRNAQIVTKKSTGENLTSNDLSVHSVIKNVIQTSERQNFRKKNIQIGKAVSLLMKLIDDGSRNTLNIWHISKQGDMHANEMQKANTLLKNGENFVETISGNVQSVIKEKSLLKTTLNPFHSVEQTISRTFNHFAEAVTAVSGRSFNIYENPELIK